MQCGGSTWKLAGGGVWLVLCGLGMSTLWTYSGEPGPIGAPAPDWTLGDAVPLAGDRPTLVLFAHPRCPCTVASMGAIERLAARFPDGFSFAAVFFEPGDAVNATDGGWRSTALWDRARAIPGGRALPDPGGRLTMQAGAVTSGVVGLYRTDGSLVFWGGVTPSRGHEGDSLGIDAISAALRGSSGHDDRAAVYGCSILGACATGVVAAGEAVP